MHGSIPVSSTETVSRTSSLFKKPQFARLFSLYHHGGKIVGLFCALSSLLKIQSFSAADFSFHVYSFGSEAI